MANKNKRLLAIFKAQQMAKKMQKEHPEMSEEEISMKVVEEMFGDQGLQMLEEVKKNPDKYASIMKDLHL